MDKQIRIFCKNNQEFIQVPAGSSLREIYDILGITLEYPVLCARVNNKTEGLNFCVYTPKDVEFLDVTSASGMRAYVRSLCFVLYKAIEDILPGARLRIEHAVSKGYFCNLNNRQPIAQEAIMRVKERMKEIIDADISFQRIDCKTSEAVEAFAADGMYDKVKLLETSHTLYTTYYQLDNRIDYYYSCLVPSTGYLKVFDLVKYDGGMLLLSPATEDPAQVSKMIAQPKMLEVFNANVRFNSIAGLSNVGSLNRLIQSGHATDLIKVSEALQEKQIARIADEIALLHKDGEGVKVVLVSGPSSSGKTTFSKRLSIQLLTNLLVPVAISLDDYFVDRENTPKDENGDYDYESLYALDLELFNDHLSRLFAGEEVDMPTYNFETGQKVYTGKKLKLKSSNILIMEGIHALNPTLTIQIPQSMKYKIYVSALTTISLDDHNWIPTADNRLLRRIVRDFKYRGSSAKSSIARWPSVRRGEEKWIFPYQEQADAMFNSALLFELAVMKHHAVPILDAVPKDCSEYGEASRLLLFLNYFNSIDEREIPPTSLLREFLGGSSFIY